MDFFYKVHDSIFGLFSSNVFNYPKDELIMYCKDINLKRFSSEADINGTDLFNELNASNLSFFPELYTHNLIWIEHLLNNNTI